MTIVGRAATRVVADRATVSLAISTVTDDIAAGKAQVDERCAAVIRIATELGIADGDLTASQLTIAPEYEWNSVGHKKHIGTLIVREISVVLRDLGNYNSLIHKLAAVPISSLKRVHMDSTTRESVEEQTMRQAVAAARRSAVAIAAEVGAELGHALVITTERNYVTMGGSAAEHASGADSFSPGTIEIAKEVTATFALRYAAEATG